MALPQADLSQPLKRPWVMPADLPLAASNNCHRVKIKKPHAMAVPKEIPQAAENNEQHTSRKNKAVPASKSKSMSQQQNEGYDHAGSGG
jgi:hypothetical protein